MVVFKERGLFPPVFTPFNEDLTINYAAISCYLEFLARNNIKGILVNGTSGEAMSQTVAERKTVVEVWVAAAKPLGIHVMVQIGGAPLPDVIELAKHAEKIKVGSILTLPELYFKPRNVDELVSYVKTVASAAPNTPVLYYHIPVNTNVAVSMPEFIKRAKESIQNFSGIKFTSNDLSEGAECLLTAGDDTAVFLGADTLLHPAICLGFDSSIGTTFNILPELAHKIVEAGINSNIQEGKAAQQQLSEVISVLVAEGTWVPVMKVGMELLTGIKVGPPRPPLKPLTAEQIKRVKETLQKKGYKIY